MAQKLELTFLGTGSATPTAKRNHAGILLSYGANNILFDCGEGIQRQFRIAKINPCKLTHIFLTHWHGDHTLGLPGLLETLDMNEYTKELHIYGPRGTKQKLALLEKVYGRFRIKHQIHEVAAKNVLREKEFSIEAANMDHRIASYAYALIIKEKRRLNKQKIKKLKLPNAPVLGKLQQGKDITHNGKTIKASAVTYIEPSKKITIVMDTGMNNNAITIAKNADLLICESTYLSDEKARAKEYKHLTATDAATIAKKANAKKLVLTHFSQRYEHNARPLLAEARKTFKNATIANDFDTITL